MPGGKRKVALQVKVKRSWQTLATTRSNGKGKFRIAGRLDWYGGHKVRVIAPGRRPFVRAKKVERRCRRTSPIGSRRDYAFIHGGSVRKNYRFNPCQRVNYRINAEDVGPAAKPLVKQALTQATWATGIRFKYVGKSKLIPYNMKNRKRYPRGTDLVIAWATHAEVPDFVRRSAAGFGGPRWIFPARNSKGQRVWMTDEAEVTLSTDYFQNGFALSFFDNTRATIGELILHEVGHALGLDHVPAAPQEIMNGRGYYRYPDGYYKGLYNLGDLNGLSKVGLKQGCLRQVGRGGRVDRSAGGHPAAALSGRRAQRLRDITTSATANPMTKKAMTAQRVRKRSWTGGTRPLRIATDEPQHPGLHVGVGGDLDPRPVLTAVPHHVLDRLHAGEQLRAPGGVQRVVLTGGAGEVPGVHEDVAGEELRDRAVERDVADVRVAQHLGRRLRVVEEVAYAALELVPGRDRVVVDRGRDLEPDARRPTRGTTGTTRPGAARRPGPPSPRRAPGRPTTPGSPRRPGR